MRVEELLTYIEELEFKSSVRGYNKDEVDFQLDKVCDEIENLMKEKEKEIAALKSELEAKPAPVPVATPIIHKGKKSEPVVAMAQYEELKKYAEEVKEQLEGKLAEEKKLRKEAEDAASENQNLSDTLRTVIAELDSKKVVVANLQKEVSSLQEELSVYKESEDGNPLEDALEHTKAQLADVTEKVNALNANLAAETKEKEAYIAQLMAAKDEAKEAEANYRGQIAALEAKLEDALDVDKAAMIPGNVAGAYDLYLKKADVLSNLIIDMDGKKDLIVREAEEAAGKTVETAKAEAEKMIQDAADQAKITTETADEYAQITSDEADQAAKKTMAEANEKAADLVGKAKAQAKETVAKAKAEVDAMLSSAKEEAEAAITAAKTEAEEILVAANEESVRITKDSVERAEAAEQKCIELDARKNGLLTELQSMNKQVFDLLSKLQ